MSRQLKLLLMSEIILISLIVFSAIVIGEMLLEWISDEYYIVFRVKEIIFSRLLSQFTTIAIGIGIGIFAVYLGKMWKPPLVFSTSDLWALTICLLISISLKFYLPIQSSSMYLYDKKTIFGIVLGVFLVGKRY